MLDPLAPPTGMLVEVPTKSLPSESMRAFSVAVPDDIVSIIKAGLVLSVPVILTPVSVSLVKRRLTLAEEALM
jgi:hypothetical protein